MNLVSITPTSSISLNVTSSSSFTPSITPTSSRSHSPTNSISQTQTPSISLSATSSISNSNSQSLTSTKTTSSSISLSHTPSSSKSHSNTKTPTSSISLTNSISSSKTNSFSVSRTLTPTSSESFSISTSPSLTQSLSLSSSISISLSNTITPSTSISLSSSITTTESISESNTQTPSSSITSSTSIFVELSLSSSIQAANTISVSNSPSLSNSPSISCTSDICGVNNNIIIGDDNSNIVEIELSQVGTENSVSIELPPNSNDFPPNSTVNVTLVPVSAIPIETGDVLSLGVVEITALTEDGEPITEFSESVEICLTVPSNTNIDSACLSFINENNEWECEDLNVIETINAEGLSLFCGKTFHFTNFAILLADIDNNDSSDISNYIIAWLSLAFVAISIITIIMGIIILEIKIRRRIQRTNIEIESRIQSIRNNDHRSSQV